MSNGGNVLANMQARCAEWALRVQDDEPIKPAAWLKDCYAQWHKSWPGVVEVVTPNAAVAVYITENYLAQVKSSLMQDFRGDFQLLVRPKDAYGDALYAWGYRCGMKPKQTGDGSQERVLQYLADWKAGNARATA